MNKIKSILASLMRRATASYGLLDVIGWHREVIERVRPFSMGSAERLLATINAVEYVVRNEIPEPSSNVVSGGEGT